MKINFLRQLDKEHTRAQSQLYWGGFLLVSLLVVLVVFPSQLFLQIGAVLSVLILFIGILPRLELGLYLLLAIGFFNGWEVALIKYEWAKNLNYLASINAPLVDIVALVLLACLAVALVFGQNHFDYRRLWFLLLPSILYGLFLSFALLSAWRVYDYSIMTSVKFWLRNMMFVFVAYVLMPGILIRRQEILERIIKIWHWVGLGVALFGLSSLLVVQQTGWHRVVPYGWGSFAPLGYNHNLIAEVLIATIPLAFYLFIKNRGRTGSDFYLASLGLMILAELLTLSRAGWLALGLQVLIAIYIFRQSIKRFISSQGRLAWLALLGIFAVLGAYMGIFLTSSIVSSSTSSRLHAMDIVLFYSARQPILGYGPGSYIPILLNTFDYTIEYGFPLEAHGFALKILLEEGLLGLVLFGLFLLTVFLFLRQAYNKSTGQTRLLAVALLSMVAGAVFFQLFNTSYFSAVMWLPIGVALAGAGLIINRY
ncbi:MAG: hypothetical protein COU31_01070 [Candidatus Magasanikbacteria bacterium CG10_big_fil_rev_8_21_14_0_10_40_10]|uniref:O-antigen ligase-related domain-containing protein n=1 Tax=Candidatus Magasanikbacteria bacterium CG10_big_fil_rev_8_21_14_0_10_40_10 TaxID=1974648 RepID=A0A2M6W4S8_9BACT|nr:MAG: hypothetical protein COU31_01070 [Candidatus Magasanikbacteria bacterium CG10_big_fil_rev_8_21_14_0_10_40_10]